MKRKLKYFIFAIIFLYQSSFAQQPKIDSLKILLETTKKDSTKANIINLLSREFWLNGNYDTSLFYSQQVLNLIENSPPHYKEKLNQQKSDALSNIGIAYKYKGEIREAINSHLLALKIREQIGNKKSIATTYNNIGLIYFELGNYSETLKNYFASLKLKENVGDQQGIANSYNAIGSVYFAMGDYENALKMQTNSLSIKEKIGDMRGVAISYIGIGNIYYRQANYSEALKNYDASLKIREKIGDKRGIAESIMGVGNIYYEQKNYDEALKNYLGCLRIMEQINYKNGINNAYIGIGNIYIMLNKPKEAAKWLDVGLKQSKEMGNKNSILHCYKSLADIDSVLGNWKSAYENYKLYKLYNDSLFNEKSNKQITEMSIKYETEKKEEQIQLLEKDKEVRNAENKRQKLVIYSVSGGLVLLFILSGVIFIALQNNRKKNKIITEQKQEVEKAKHIIEERHKEQTDSINYAKRLQEAILPPTALLKKELPECFVIYQPKDIVAGDFYWMEKIDTIIFIAAADCTGHGVPGAMVSVVCSNALNRAVKEFGLRDTGKILDKVTDLVLETFEKSTTNVQDGMDISLLAFNTTTKQIQWSGANNPLWYISNGQVTEIKANKQPIGKYDNRKPFTAHNIHYTDNSVYYLFTDGFADQFGGPKGKKFTYRRLEETILSTSNLTMQEQENQLKLAFHLWKGTAEQIDDVTIIAIKI